MRVLIACEESQRVCCAFRERGHEAFSCDVAEPNVIENIGEFTMPGSKTRRGRVGVDVANTLDTGYNQGIFIRISVNLEIYAVYYPKKECYVAIRRLTPKECFRLQGWTDDYFERAELVNSDSQLYKQAGNGVTVNVVEAIAKKMR